VPERFDRSQMRAVRPWPLAMPRSKPLGVPRRKYPWAMLGFALSLCGLPARADELDLSQFLAPLGRAATLRIEQPGPAPHGTVDVGLTFDYAHELIDRGVACAAEDTYSFCGGDGRSRALVADLARAELSASLSLWKTLEFGLGLPFSLTRAAADPEASLVMRFGLADLRFGLGVMLVGEGATRMAARLDTTWPTASDYSYSGSKSWTLTPGFVLTHALPRVTFAAKLGYHLRERLLVYDIEQDDELVVQLGAAFAAWPWLSVLADVSSSFGLGGLSLSKREVSLEVDVGARWHGPGSTSIELAVGTSALPRDQFGLVAAVRGLLSVRAAFEPAPAPVVAEVARDSDGDGFADDQDACVYDAEDHDGFADDDGCPDPDNDADGLLDAQDACPDRSEDSDGFQDQDGCPEADNDEDAVADGADRCRMAPEDRDGFEDFDGCPEPGPERPAVTLSGSRSLLADTIYFEGQADSISPGSRPLLDELARTLRRLPAHKRVRVEGYTDDAGNPERNIDLSYRRAKAVVEYLKARGVPADRLEYAGYGGTKPLADNRTPEGRALNRRVQFSLIDAPP
jgi:outer membrane protein OmpA-like peptidoglycan-associated protein